MRWFLPDDETPRGARAALFDVMLRTVHLARDVCYTTEDVVGGALWVPPGTLAAGRRRSRSRLLPGMLRVFGRGLRARAARADRDGRRAIRASRTTTSTRSASSPEWQGRGLGSALMQPVLERCDRERMPAYLNAGSPRSRDLYLRHGFEVMEEFGCPRTARRCGGCGGSPEVRLTHSGRIGLLVNVRRVSDRQKRLTLIACILGSAIVFIDGTVVNVALPAIRADLDAGLADAAVDRRGVPAHARLADPDRRLAERPLRAAPDLRARHGAASASTSLLCAIAPNAELADRRAGAAGHRRARCSCRARCATIVAVFPEYERGRAIGTWTAWSGVSTVIGPLAGGVLIDSPPGGGCSRINLLPGRGDALPDRDAQLPREPRRAPGARARRRARRGPVRARPRRAGVRADRAAAIRVERPASWSVPLVPRLVLLAAFVVAGAPEPASRCCRSSLFRARNFAVANLATLVDLRRARRRAVLPDRCSSRRPRATRRSTPASR